MEIGKMASLQEVVTADKTAKAMGSGSLEVYATPAMIALMEKAACACVAEDLASGQSTVGTMVDIAHKSATPVGMEVTCEAKLVARVDRRLEFNVVARDEAGVIGEGRHERFVIDVERFMGKTQGKKK